MFICIKLRLIVMSTNLEIEQEKDREKEKVGGRPAQLNEKKGDRGLEEEINNKGDIFLLEEQHDNCVAAVISSHQCKVKMSGSEKKVKKKSTTFPP